MNALQSLRAYIEAEFPNAKIELTAPSSKGGFWSLDVHSGKTQLAIHWNEKSGFGLANVDSDSYGEGPDEVISSLALVKSRVKQLLSGSERTSPPLPVLLKRLRESRGITQG